MLYLVTRTPKGKYRNAYYTLAVVVEAKSGAEAVRLANTNEDFGRKQVDPRYVNDYGAPKAEPLQLQTIYRL